MAGRYLITGVAGSGKSTLEQAFRERGYRTVDIDDGFAEWRDHFTGEIVEYAPENPEWHDRTDWAFRPEAMMQFLDSEPDSLTFVFGSAHNLDKHLSLFDTVFLLEYPDEATARARIMQRVDGYGKNPHELKRVLGYIEHYQRAMREHGALAIDCTLPIDEIVAIIRNETM